MSATTLNPADKRRYAQELARTRVTLQRALALAHRPVASTKFNARSGVLLHLLSALAPGIPVIWVDTGYNTRDTLAFAHYLTALLSLDVRIYRPQGHSVRVPPALGSTEHDHFVQVVKLAPFQYGLDELQPDVWFTAIRLEQSGFRQSLAMRDTVRAGLEKISPLLRWPERYMDHYLAEHGIARGPECYDPTKGEPMRECGLHTTLWSDTPAAASRTVSRCG